MSARAYTPERVAEIYGCSANHIRNLIKRGELRAFRLGPKLLRIPADALEEYERCRMNTASEGSREDGSFHGGETGSANAIVLKLPAGRTRSEKQST